MPGSIVPSVITGGSGSVFGNSVPRGGLESSLILNRISAGLGLNGDSYSSTGVDTAVLALELKRHERKRNMMRYGSFRNDERLEEERSAKEQGHQEQRRNRVAAVRERLANREANRFAKELDQWLKKMKCR